MSNESHFGGVLVGGKALARGAWRVAAPPSCGAEKGRLASRLRLDPLSIRLPLSPVNPAKEQSHEFLAARSALCS
jgi:hypothetical protein